MPTVFIPKETVPGETRIAAVPDTVKKMVASGFSVSVEAGAGAGSFISDAAFEKAGATVQPDAAKGFAGADLVAKFEEAGRLKQGSLLISFLWPFTSGELVEKLRVGRVSAFAMDLIPRITRAQKHDALSSQANIAGYKAVILAADTAPKLFPMLMTAAGTIRPVRVVIMGAGVAGLQAVATAKRLGAVVEVSDIRPAVKEQVESLGGKFIEVPTEEVLEDAGGYAKEVSAEFLRKQQEIVRKHVVQADVVITTALVPGKPAPRLISGDMVREMKDGAVIVDLAVEQGGNCELSEPGRIVSKEGVTIVGLLNIPALLPVHASEMYARNILNVFTDVVKEGGVALDFEDEVVAGSVVTHQGEIRHERVAEALGAGGKA